MFEQNQDFHHPLGSAQQQQQNGDYQQQQPDQSMMSTTMATTSSSTPTADATNTSTANMVDHDRDGGSGGDGDLYYQDRLAIVTTEMLPSSSTATITNANDGYFQCHETQQQQQQPPTHHQHQQHQEYQLQSTSTTGSNPTTVDDQNCTSGDATTVATSNAPTGTTLDYQTLLPDQHHQAAIINSSDADILLQDLFATPETLPNSTTNLNTMDYANMSRADSSSASLSAQQHQNSPNENLSVEYSPKKSSSLDQTFVYVDSLMEDYGREDDPNNGDSSDGACHDFLTNLEVDADPDTKVVVDQFIASTTTTMEDASASMITSSEDILQQTGNGMTDTDVVDCLVNEEWFSHQTNSRSSLGGSSSVSSPAAPTSLGQSILGQLQTAPPPPPPPEESSSGSFSVKPAISAVKANDSFVPINETVSEVPAEKITLQTEASSPKSSDAKSFGSGSDVNNSPMTKPSSATCSSNSSNSTVAISIGSGNVSANKDNSPIHQYLTNTDPDEIPRHTICPLCDNARSFCSSSSVTRHLRSVHKLTELMDTKYCYCVLCNQFQEDIGAFYEHLEFGHGIDLQKNFQMFFTKRFFNTFDEFVKWKEQELEAQTGCRYERCISYDYPRSLYYKCTGIQIETSGPENPSAKTCRVTLKFPSQNDSSRMETGDLSKLSPVSSNPDANVDANNNWPLEKENSVSLKIDNQCDARMYPCPSSANYVPFHLGHILAGTCASTTSAVPPAPKPSLKRALNPGSSGGSKIKKQNQMVQTSSPLPANATINSPMEVQSFLANNNQQMVAIAATPTGSAGGQTTTVTLSQSQLASLANIQLAAAGGAKNASTQLVHFPVVNLVGGNLVLAAAPSNMVVSGSKTVNRLQMQSSQQTPKSFMSVSTQSDQSGPKTFQLFNSFDSTGQTVSTSMVAAQQRTLAPVAVSTPPQPQQIQLQKVRINSVDRRQDNPQTDVNGSTYQAAPPLLQQQSYHPADSSSHSAAEELDNAAASTANNATVVPVTANLINSSNSQPQSNGLVIVSLEKGMEMVQEQFRPRKENLRLAFEQLLSTCFTESDFDILESSLASISQHFQMISLGGGSGEPTNSAPIGTSTTSSSTVVASSTAVGLKQ